MDRLLTIDQAAERLSVSPGTVRQLLPRLGAVDLNQGGKGRRLIRIPESGLLQFLNGSVIPAPQKPERVQRGPRDGFHVERRHVRGVEG